ncbi:Uncharacterized protein APZ42_018270 [Daphnia magna]|uniref:Uncharacterized protein n=1 Tax=Daphnia magna TaxID=35525 RepID=A0A162CR44_9CRUS|nr:Uncharacterized protein APZ42_018270 [Daphnia magna]
MISFRIGWFFSASWIVSEKKPRPDRHLKLKHTWVGLIRSGCCIMADLLFCPKSRHKEGLNQDVSFERTSSVSGGMSLFAYSHHPDPCHNPQPLQRNPLNVIHVAEQPVANTRDHLATLYYMKQVSTSTKEIRPQATSVTRLPTRSRLVSGRWPFLESANFISGEWYTFFFLFSFRQFALSKQMPRVFIFLIREYVDC